MLSYRSCLPSPWLCTLNHKKILWFHGLRSYDTREMVPIFMYNHQNTHQYFPWLCIKSLLLELKGSLWYFGNTTLSHLFPVALSSPSVCTVTLCTQVYNLRVQSQTVHAAVHDGRDMLYCSGFSSSLAFVLSGAKLANFFYAPKKCTLSESYSLPPVTFQLSLMKTKMPVSCFLCCPGLYVGHNSGDRNRTPFGVCVSGSCIIILYEIQALGGRVFASQMVLSAGA